MFDIGLPEFMVLAIVALFVFGPERLPQAARKAAETIRSIRQMATNARRDLADELGPEFQNLDLNDIRNPRGALKKYVLDGIDEDDVRIDKDLDLKKDLESLDGESAKPKSRKQTLNGSESNESGETAESDTEARGDESRTLTLETPDPPPFDPDAT